MNSPFTGDNDRLQGQLQSLRATVTAIAKENQGDCHGLLLLLRTLESLHREIRSGLFEPSLPDTRQSLYGLLREIEETGGWPYIERMKLQFLLGKLLESETTRSEDLPARGEGEK
ncbi:hypothetical protein V0288_23980 [Pannus brasiliensis CCIBt3594]|uniref:Uncharacterized protein n=1 Tax=Pannus brasiliensis CCIBt3594 TaxID=1427578 RepID=A0AAW9QTF8_9CHRO